MQQYDELVFSGVTEIVAAALEEAEITFDEAGGRQVAAFFRAIYDGLACPQQPASGGWYEVIRDAKGEYRFRLKAANGEVVAVSEGYQAKASCLKGIESARRNAACAVRDLTQQEEGQ